MTMTIINNKEGVAAEDRDDQAAEAVGRDDHAVAAVVYDGGAQPAVAVMERKDLEEGVDGGRQVVAVEQKVQEAVEGGGSGT